MVVRGYQGNISTALCVQLTLSAPLMQHADVNFNFPFAIGLDDQRRIFSC